MTQGLEMKRFMWKALLFTFPYLAVGGAITFPLLASGELMDVRQAVEAQVEDNSVLYGPAYLNPNPLYKLESAAARKTEVLVLGTSRVLQFRDYFATEEPERFYNAGRGVRRIGEVLDFLGRLQEESRPKVVILGLDQYFFNARWDPVTDRESPIDRQLKAGAPEAAVQAREIVADYLRGKFSLADMFRTRDPVAGIYRPFGLRAKTQGGGFRYDGSAAEGRSQMIRARGGRPDFRENLKRIEDGNRRFEYGREVSPAALAEMKRILAYCRDQDIHLVGFLPPFARVVLERMRETGKYGYMERLPGALSPLFAEYGQVFFDFSDNHSFGSNDDETIGDDPGFHGSEVAYLRLFLEMVKVDGALAKYADREKLATLLEKKASATVLLERERVRDAR